MGDGKGGYSVHSGWGLEDPMDDICARRGSRGAEVEEEEEVSSLSLNLIYRAPRAVLSRVSDGLPKLRSRIGFTSSYFPPRRHSAGFECSH
jgi:hypothetical protein